MADPRFFTRQGPFSLAQLQDICHATLAAGADDSRVLCDIATLDQAGPESLSFLDNVLYLDAFAESRAGACIVHPQHAERSPPEMALLLSETPYKAFALAARAFYPAAVAQPGVDPAAVIDSSSTLGADVTIAAGTVIGPHAVIGERCVIGANAVVGAGVEIGDDSAVGALVALSHCLIGKRVTIYPGAKIGQDGFSFASDPEGFISMPQFGRVIIHDDVEIGANTTIDRGSVRDTVIGAGSRIDNLVHIGHNVQMGKGCIIVSEVGISGSTTLGDYVVVGGQTGMAGHLTIGDGAQIAAKSGIVKNVAAGARVAGYPAVPIRQWHRQHFTLAKLAKRKGTSDE